MSFSATPIQSKSSVLPLDRGERLLWSGIPQQGIMFRTQDVFLVPFSLLWCGFAIFWEMGATVANNAPAFFVLWGAAFVLVGLYFVFGRFIVDAILRARTVYAVTDQRVLIVSGLVGQTVQSLSLAGLNEVELQQRRSGRGSIVFGRSQGYAGMWGRGWPGAARYMAPAFEGIEEPKRVYDLIRRTQQAPR